VTPIENPKSHIANSLEALPLSLLNDYLYCPRRAALKVVEGWRSANQHTARGDIAHEHADLRGYEVVQGVRLLRALPVFSDRLGLSGKCDIVEVHPVTAEVTGLNLSKAESGKQKAETQSEPPHVGCYDRLFPVEFKVGKRRQWENDDAQLCAQALCLEEMFHTSIPRGAVFHADSKRRREVEFSPELRALTEKTIAELHALLDSTAIPRAEFREACEECSLYEICLPQATDGGSRAERLASELFQI
jgi:CRISPR-associated exonuclease Cas4